jgi:hypothetical protein
MKKALFTSLFGISVFALPAAPVGAVNPKNIGCPAGFEVKTVKQVQDVAHPAFIPIIPTYDVNQDNLLCFKLLPEPIPLFEPTFLFFDNTAGTTRT